MLPYLSFGVLVFMLLAGFFLGTMFGYLIKELGTRRFGYDPEGGKPLPQTSDRGAKIIPFPMKGRRRKAS